MTFLCTAGRYKIQAQSGKPILKGSRERFSQCEDGGGYFQRGQTRKWQSEFSGAGITSFARISTQASLNSKVQFLPSEVRAILWEMIFRRRYGWEGSKASVLPMSHWSRNCFWWRWLHCTNCIIDEETFFMHPFSAHKQIYVSCLSSRLKLPWKCAVLLQRKSASSPGLSYVIKTRASWLVLNWDE